MRDSVSSPTRRAAAGRAQLLLAAAVILVAANLRTAAAAVGPLLPDIRSDLGLSGTVGGILVTVPVVCFGALAPLAPLLAHRLGHPRTVALLLLAIVVGLLVRLEPGIAPLFAGTAIAGAGAAVGNVLLPVIVRQRFPTHTGLMTGLYMTAMVGVAALAAGVAVPVTDAIGHGWRAGLAVWAAPALVALIVWSPQLRARAAGPPVQRADLRSALRSPLAWQLTAFFGLQSCSFYIVLSWLPTIFESHGISDARAGGLLALSVICGLPGALIVPSLASRVRDQRGLALAFSSLIACGMVGLLAAPTAVPELWAVLIGLGQGTSFPLALIMIVLRSRDLGATAGLSTLVQTAGYLLAATGPLGVGTLHDLTDSWTAAVVLLLVLVVPQAAAGMGAGRDRHVGADQAATRA